MNEKDKEINHGNGLVEHISYWDNGKVFQHYTMLNNKIYGEFRRYNEDGKLCYHDYNINNKQEGERLLYYYE